MLDGKPVRLPPPADEGRTVILDCQLVSEHRPVRPQHSRPTPVERTARRAARFGPPGGRKPGLPANAARGSCLSRTPNRVRRNLPEAIRHGLPPGYDPCSSGRLSTQGPPTVPGSDKPRSRPDGRAPEEGLRGHGGPSRPLHFEEHDRPVAAGDRQPVAQNFARNTATIDDRRPEDFEPSSVKRGEGARHRVQPMDPVAHRGGRHCPVDGRLFLADLLRVGRAPGRLLAKLEGATLQPRQGPGP